MRESSLARNLLKTAYIAFTHLKTFRLVLKIKNNAFIKIDKLYRFDFTRSRSLNSRRKILSTAVFHLTSLGQVLKENKRKTLEITQNWCVKMSNVSSCYNLCQQDDTERETMLVLKTSWRFWSFTLVKFIFGRGFYE